MRIHDSYQLIAKQSTNKISQTQAQEYWSINAELKKDVRIETKLSSFEGKPVKKFTFLSKTIVESAAVKLESNCKDGLLVQYGWVVIIY